MSPGSCGREYSQDCNWERAGGICLLDRARNSTSVFLPACWSRAWTAASTSTAGPPRRRPCVRAAAARTTCGSLANACSGRSIDDDLANRRLDRLLRGPARDRGPRRTACRAHQRRRGRDASWTFRSVAAGRGARVARTAAAPRDVPRSIHAPFGGLLDLSDPNRHHRHAAIGAISRPQPHSRISAVTVWSSIRVTSHGTARTSHNGCRRSVTRCRCSPELASGWTSCSR